MENNNLGLILGAIGAAIICGVGYYVVKQSKNRSNSNYNVAVRKDFSNESSQNINVKKSMDKYFENIKENYSQYYLFTFYSRVLDIKEYKKESSLDEELYKTFSEIGLSLEEENSAYKYMKSTIDNIFAQYNMKEYRMEKIGYRSFLEKYYEFIGKKEALDTLKSKTPKIDEWNTYYEKNNKYILDLLKKFTV